MASSKLIYINQAKTSANAESDVPILLLVMSLCVPTPVLEDGVEEQYPADL